MSQKTLLEAQNDAIWADEVRLAVGPTVVGRTVTTDATPTTLVSLPLLPSRTTFLRVQVVARRTGGSGGTAEDGAAYLLAGTYKVIAGVATLIGSVSTLFSAESQAGWDATLVVSNGNVLVQVTGAVDNTLTWAGKAHVETVNI